MDGVVCCSNEPERRFMGNSANKIFTYLDANATEPLRPQAREAMNQAADEVGNPSSPHRAGRTARALLEAARDRIAGLFNGEPDDLIFTSGGTEANILALHAVARPILAGATEHDCIRNALPSGHPAQPGSGIIPVAADGTLRLDELERLLADAPGPALVCTMLANNETGVIHPLHEIAAACRRHGAWLHVDAVQAAGRIRVSLADLGADSLSLSAHKLGGPKGAGALMLGGQRRGRLAPLMAGGGQESGRRGGTPALPAIAGFAAAATAAHDDLDARAGSHNYLRDRIDRAAAGSGAMICGTGANRLPNTTCLALPGRRAEAQLIALDLAGYAVSAGSACSSGKVARSHVLEAMGLGAVAGEAIRISLPWNVVPEAVEGFLDAYMAMAGRANATRRGAA